MFLGIAVFLASIIVACVALGLEALAENDKRERLKNGIVREEHYGEEVWVSRLGESLRKKNCLCLQCAKMKPSPDNCPYAQAFYKNCKEGNIAMMVTRCRDRQPKDPGEKRK